MENLFWRPTNIGETPFENLFIAENNNGQHLLRFITKSQSEIVKEKAESIEGDNYVIYDYSSPEENVNFAIDIMDKTSYAIDSCLKRLKQKRSSYLDSSLTEALDEYKNIQPKELIITGNQNEIVIDYKLNLL